MRTGQFLVKGQVLGTDQVVSIPTPSSVLVFPFCIFDSNSPLLTNTEITINNTHTSTLARLDLFFISQDGELTIDRTRTVAARSSLTLKISDVFSQTVGYLIVVMRDVDDYPIKFNYLTGSERVYVESGQNGTINATSVKCVQNIQWWPPGKDPLDPDPTPPGPLNLLKISMPFDGVSYEKLPSSSRVMKNVREDSIFALASISGELGGGVAKMQKFSEFRAVLLASDKKALYMGNMLPIKTIYYGTLSDLFPSAKEDMSQFWSGGDCSIRFEPWGPNNFNLFQILFNR